MLPDKNVRYVTREKRKWTGYQREKRFDMLLIDTLLQTKRRWTGYE